MTLLGSRVFNTLLLFIAGGALGYALKGSLFRLPAQSPAASPQRTAAEAGSAAPSAREAQEDPDLDEPLSDEPEIVPGTEDHGPAAAGGEPAAELVAAPEPARAAVTSGEEEGFFRSPGNYIGRELEMELQMITAKKTPGKWRLNLVYTGPGRSIEYLYVDDDELLGEKPDLRIGYAYKVRFRCGSGVTTSGNTLLSIAATGRKAAWATGISALE